MKRAAGTVRRRKNAEETRLALLTAFARLHKTKPYHDITITAICEEAGVANSTFYYYFSSVNEMVSDRFEKLVSELDQACAKKDMAEAVHLGVECAVREKEIFLLMADYSAETRDEVYHRCVLPFVRKYVATDENASSFTECIIISLVSGIVGLLYSWLKKGRAFTVNEVETTIVEMMEMARSQCEIRRTLTQLI